MMIGKKAGNKIQKLLCQLGFHKYWPEDRNLYEDEKITFRTFMVCVRCKKVGKHGLMEREAKGVDIG